MERTSCGLAVEPVSPVDAEALIDFLRQLDGGPRSARRKVIEHLSTATQLGRDTGKAAVTQAPCCELLSKRGGHLFFVYSGLT